jgi:hypothetical protein
MAIIYDINKTGINIDDCYIPDVLYEHFINRYDTYAIQVGNNGYRRVTETLTPDIVNKHLEGDITIGTYQLSIFNKVKWVCIDIDSHGDADPVQVQIDSLEICNRLDAYRIPYICELSGSCVSKHIWLLMDNVDATKAYHFGRELIKGYNYEVYPKQSSLGRKGFGNLVKLPYGVNRKNYIRSKILKVGCRELTKINLDVYEIPVDQREPAKTNKGCSPRSIVHPSQPVVRSMKPCLYQV